MRRSGVRLSSPAPEDAGQAVAHEVLLTTHRFFFARPSRMPDGPTAWLRPWRRVRPLRRRRALAQRLYLRSDSEKLVQHLGRQYARRVVLPAPIVAVPGA